MGMIELSNMEFYARHGFYEQERIIGNRFRVDLKMEADFGLSPDTDELADTLNYEQAFLLVKQQMEQPSKLLEHVANRILNALFDSFGQLVYAQVSVSKMAPPMGGQIEKVTVTLSRHR
jgi:dihydroneopterin aldolase